MGHFTEEFNNELKTDPLYYRSLYQSYMTASEWRNVEISEEFAAFMEEGNSMFHAPYFTQIINIWHVLIASYYIARKHDDDYKILTSAYMIMDLFVTLFTTFELLPKAILSLFLSPFLPQKNNSEMQSKFAEYFAVYAQDIQTEPFYKHNFKGHREALAEQYKTCEKPTWNDWLTWSYLSSEMWIKQAVSNVVGKAWSDPNTVPCSPTTSILVKFTTNGMDSNAAEESFNNKLNSAIKKFKDSVIVDKELTAEDDIEIIGDIFFKKNIDKSQVSVYARLTAPRYADFHKAVNALATEDIYLRKIAGQNNVQVKMELNADNETFLKTAIAEINTQSDVIPLYNYKDGIHPNRKLCLFDVPVKNLHTTLHKLESVTNEQSTSCVKFIHNF